MGKQTLVIGLGISGKAAAEFLLKKGVSVIAVDRRPEVLAEFQTLGGLPLREGEPLDMSTIDTVVVSPGVSPSHPLYREAVRRQIPVIGEAELACRTLQQPLLGITGTNGKTTVTLLVTHILNQSGRPAKAVGNVGSAMTAEVEQAKAAIIVAELSSYQLETLQSRVIDAAVLLNITPDHLDRYSSMDAYAKAKVRIKECLKPTGTLFVEEKTYHEYSYLFGDFVPETYTKENVADIYPFAYRGRASHDVENIMAAYALCRAMGVTPSEFKAGLDTFTKPPHRMEFVRKVNGVAYYNDSKGTNIDAVVRAVEAVPGEIVLIAGGVDKGATYAPWKEAFAGNVKHICLIGQAAAAIDQALSDRYPTSHCASLEEALEQATSVARAGDSVMLSPGCSSFDMFENYAQRGDAFKRWVHALEE